MLQSQTVNHLEEIRKIHFKGTIWWSGCYLLPAKLLQSCPTLCDPIDGSPPGFPVPGILQARPLEWVAISFSKAWKWKVKVKLLSRVRLFMTPWTAAHQAPPSMGFSRQEYWSGVPLLQFMGSQRIGHDWGTELNWTEDWRAIKVFTFYLVNVKYFAILATINKIIKVSNIILFWLAWRD